MESSNCLRLCQRTVSGLLLDADHLRQGSQREPILFKLSSANSVLQSYSLAAFPYISVWDIKTDYQYLPKSLQEATRQQRDSGLPSLNGNLLQSSSSLVDYLHLYLNHKTWF